MLPNGSERDRLIDEEPELVLPLELHHGLDVADLARVHVDAFDNEEASRDLGLFRVLLVLYSLGFEQLFEVFGIVVPEVFDLAPGGVQALLDRKVHAFITDRKWKRKRTNVS